ncbi:MAG: hypothetical protein IJB23_00310 [Alistipes sp.]|nr:hypothetical protein [Alistipes sp.]
MLELCTLQKVALYLIALEDFVEQRRHGEEWVEIICR